MNEHLKGLLVTTPGVFLVVPASSFVRLIEAEPVVAAFWRGATAGLVILVVLIAVQGVQSLRAALHTGWPGLINAVLTGTTAPAFRRSGRGRHAPCLEHFRLVEAGRAMGSARPARNAAFARFEGPGARDFGRCVDLRGQLPDSFGARRRQPSPASPDKG